MGLFDFAANIGKKIFGGDDANASEKIVEHIQANNPGITSLTASLDDEVCTLGGDCDSSAAKEKVVLMAGNMKGVASVNADSVSAPEPKPEQQVEYYTIQKGDTLWAIASKFLGNGAKYTEIVDANLEVIEDADLIFPGQKIRIPKS